MGWFWHGRNGQVWNRQDRKVWVWQESSGREASVEAWLGWDGKSRSGLVSSGASGKVWIGRKGLEWAGVDGKREDGTEAVGIGVAGAVRLAGTRYG